MCEFESIAGEGVGGGLIGLPVSTCSGRGRSRGRHPDGVFALGRWPRIPLAWIQEFLRGAVEGQHAGFSAVVMTVDVTPNSA